MTEAETIVDTVDYDGDYIKSITIVRTDSDEYPEGWKYRLHYGTVDGRTVIRYDNSHGVHERHTGDEVEEIEFAGITETVKRFQRETKEMD